MGSPDAYEFAIGQFARVVLVGGHGFIRAALRAMPPHPSPLPRGEGGRRSGEGFRFGTTEVVPFHAKFCRLPGPPLVFAAGCPYFSWREVPFLGRRRSGVAG